MDEPSDSFQGMQKNTGRILPYRQPKIRTEILGE